MLTQKSIKVFCTARRYDKSALFSYLGSRYKTTIIKDAAIVELSTGGVAIFFSYGVSVFWDVDYESQKYLLDEISEYSKERFGKPIFEDFNYMMDNSQQNPKITRDIFILNDDSNLVKLAISYPLSQSTELYYFEEAVITIINRNEFLVNELVKRGRIKLPQKQLSMERGKIFREISEIYLSYGFLDVPEFFWEYPELEPVYQSTANYLDIKPRIEVLNKKLAVIQDLLNMISDEQKHNHSAFLETVIIILIAIEIIINIIKW